MVIMPEFRALNNRIYRNSLKSKNPELNLKKGVIFRKGHCLVNTSIIYVLALVPALRAGNTL